MSVVGFLQATSLALVLFWLLRHRLREKMFLLWTKFWAAAGERKLASILCCRTTLQVPAFTLGKGLEVLIDCAAVAPASEKMLHNIAVVQIRCVLCQKKAFVNAGLGVLG